MKFQPILWCMLCFGIHASLAQMTIPLKNGEYVPLTITADRSGIDYPQYHFYSANRALTASERAKLADQGIECLFALRNYTYFIRVNRPVAASLTAQMFDLDPAYKLGIDAATREAVNHIRISVAPGISVSWLEAWAAQNGITLLETRGLPFGMVDVEMNTTKLDAVINTPWVIYISNVPVDEEIQFRGSAAERGTGLMSPLFRGLSGKGITVGIGDGGRLGEHEDLSRFLDLSAFGVSTHATQVAGIVAGTNAINPYWGRGYAPDAHVIMRNSSDILLSAPEYVENFGLTLTNNSYTSALINCTYHGDYDGTSYALDAMMRAYPTLLHVFAAGNSGGLTCAPFSLGYGTIGGGYQTTKNLLTVGAVNNFDGVAVYSSRGPVDDGRLKPEVVACGTDRYSTVPGNVYSNNSGTSFSSPATVGVAALLTERYKQLHNDSVPEATLIKNVICNAATDLGLEGPDFLYGFGRVNGVRAAEILEAGRFADVTIDHGNSVQMTFNIPANTSIANVMLMWCDPASAPYETVTLVNDLDLAVISPNGDTLHPWRPDYTPAGVTQVAPKGYDRVNPVEQVTINAPVAGTYTIKVSGYSVPMGAQKAWLSWDICPPGIRVQFPNGGEILRPGNPNVPSDQQVIRWDFYGTGNSTFTVDYSLNNGTTWTTIASNLPGNIRFLGWYPPVATSDQVRVRVTAANGMTDQSDYPFTIMLPPTNLTASSPCNGYVQLNWSAVSGAAKYKIYRIIKGEVTLIDSTTTTNYLASGLPSDSTVWLAVAGAFSSGKAGLRARAADIVPNGGDNCGWADDLRADAVSQPVTGRDFTSTALAANETISLDITNVGTSNASGFSLSYAVNDGPVITEAFPGNIAAGASLTYNFSQQANFSSPGLYTIKAWISYANDTRHDNDTIFSEVFHLTNPVIVLPWEEDFESMPPAFITKATIGGPLGDAWDALPGSGARVRTFAGSSFSHSGLRALTVDAVSNGNPVNADLILTLNLSGYSTNTDDIRLNFMAMHHEIIQDTVNQEKVLVRGSDADPFVPLVDIADDPSLRGVWQNYAGLQVSNVLQAAGQNFSSSFQIKFAYSVYAPAGSIRIQDGQTIDDISLYRVEKDVTVEELVYPENISCGLGAETISVRIANTSGANVSDISVHCQVDGGSILTKSAGSLGAGLQTVVIFDQTSDFSLAKRYAVKIWTTSPDDQFPFNDTLMTSVIHTPLVATFPYTEGFENGPGGFIADGIASSWAFGKPGKLSISRAAEGENVWATSLTGYYNADETSYLYSPCFDLNGITDPWLSFALRYEIEADYDFAWVEYRVEGSEVWNKLGAQGTGVNWYNHSSDSWHGELSSWQTAGHSIPVTHTTVQFRWVMMTDVGVQLEGLAIDQVHVYDRQALYNGTNVQVATAVSGNNWVHITSGGQRVLSIHPQGQNLGMATVNLYKAANNFIVTDSMYLLSRNWVVNFSQPPANPVRIRGYFHSTEAMNLVDASGCGDCANARDAFDVLAVAYTGPSQDGSFANNQTLQVAPSSLDETEIVPFDQGYFAEWETNLSAAEWWIASTVTKWAGTITRQVSASSDDAEEHLLSGSVNPVRDRLDLGGDVVGLRFSNIPIPRGSVITSARLECTAGAPASGAANWWLQSQMATSSPGFTTTKYNISLRNRTQQVVQWQTGAWTTSDAVYVSPDISHIIQPIIDQAGWDNGNDLAIIIRGDGQREAWSYDGDPEKAVRLVITFDNACTSDPICYVNHQANGLQDGSSWTNAYRSLEQALDRAAHCPDIDEIWMAEGTYKPFVETPASFTYAIPAGVRLYGGFAGSETSPGQRVYGAHPTIISGDVGVPGVPTDNLIQVVTVLSGNPGVWIDGVTVKDGQGN